MHWEHREKFLFVCRYKTWKKSQFLHRFNFSWTNSFYWDIGSTSSYLHDRQIAWRKPKKLNYKYFNFCFAHATYELVELLLLASFFGPPAELENLGLWPNHSLHHQMWCNATWSRAGTSVGNFVVTLHITMYAVSLSILVILCRMSHLIK